MLIVNCNYATSLLPSSHNQHSSIKCLTAVIVLLMYGICNIVLILLNYFQYIQHRNRRDWTVPTMYNFKLFNFTFT
jgi:hypothetical protein